MSASPKQGINSHNPILCIEKSLGMSWYMCPHQHFFETKGATGVGGKRDIFCKLCNKILPRQECKRWQNLRWARKHYERLLITRPPPPYRHTSPSTGT